MAASHALPAFRFATPILTRRHRSLPLTQALQPTHRPPTPARRAHACLHRPSTPPPRGDTLVLVGLGNPGPRYANTRHNVGFLLADLLATRNNATFTPDKRVQADVAVAQVGGRTLQILKPRTFMNLSGAAVRAALRRYNASPAALLVVADDMSLEVGRLRLRARGSAGGHNGLKSVEAALGGREYARLKVGVGSPHGGPEDWKEHVLGGFSRAERAVLEDVLVDCAEVVELWAGEPEIDRVISRVGTVKGGRR